MGKYVGIGMMTGTSLDGIDLVAVAFEENELGNWRFEILQSEEIPLDEKWYARLRCLDTADARTYARTHVYWGHHLGKVLADFIQRNQLEVQFAAAHGQTIFHEPHRNYTAQIGDGETMVSYLDIPLVTNFRNKDVALGGQGAPLVPFGERALFPNQRLFLNLGGIANLSYHQSNGEVLAFDVCAANMALNWLARNLQPPLPYDPDGQLAASGEIIPELMEALEALPFYQQAPPKSLGTEWFEAKVLPLISNPAWEVADRLHSYTEHLAQQIAAAVGACGGQNQSLLATGGGIRNKFLHERLKVNLNPLGVQLEDAPAMVVDFKEALIFAFLGLQTLLGRPNVLASVTGAAYSNLGGSIHLPPKGGQPLL